jgi:hypothetical protein
MNYQSLSHFNEMHVLNSVPHVAQIISDLLEHFFTLSYSVHRTPIISVNSCLIIVAHPKKKKIQ